MALIDEIARDYTAMLRLGQFVAAGERYWAETVTSREPVALESGSPAEISGVEAVRAKCRTRFAGGRIDDLSIDGPFVTGNQFALFLDMLIVAPACGSARNFTEIAVFTVLAGRIVEERFFYD